MKRSARRYHSFTACSTSSEHRSLTHRSRSAVPSRMNPASVSLVCVRRLRSSNRPSSAARAARSRPSLFQFQLIDSHLPPSQRRSLRRRFLLHFNLEWLLVTDRLDLWFRFAELPAHRLAIALSNLPAVLFLAPRALPRALPRDRPCHAACHAETDGL